MPARRQVLQDQMTSRVSTLEAEKAQLLEVIRQKDEEIARLNAREEEIEKDKTDEVRGVRTRESQAAKPLATRARRCGGCQVGGK